MTNEASPAQHRPGSSSGPASSPHGRFEFLLAGDREPAIVRVAGDIDLINVGQFQSALDQAAATASAITADMTAVTYCDSAAIRARSTKPCSASPASTRSPPSSRWT